MIEIRLLGQFSVREDGSPRLLWDVHTALSEYYAATGDADLQEKHRAAVKDVVGQMAANLTDPELKLGLPAV